MIAITYFPLVVVYGRVCWGHMRTVPVPRISPRGVYLAAFFSRLGRLKIVTLYIHSLDVAISHT